MPSVILLPESIVIPIVDGLTPESSSVTVHVIVGLLLTSVADAVGFVTVITGATFSLTVNRRELPIAESVASLVVTFPASSVALIVIP